MQGMPRATANGIELEYEVTGEGEPLLLIMGIGAQLVTWPRGLIDAFVGRGFRVIRFDNRDAGLSTRIDEARAPRVMRTMVRGLLGLRVEAPYTLFDMADDAAALLDALEIDTAHVLGASLGGMVAQSMAITHPRRMRTMTSVMSNTGNRLTAIARPKAIKALLGKAPRTEEEAVEYMLHFRRVCGSTGFPFDADMHADIARQTYRRGMHPRGFARQLAAIMATGDRTRALRHVRVPTLVVHGSADPLLPPVGGRATARAIPGARLRIIDGMGHDLPKEVWPILAEEVSTLATANDPRLANRERAAG